MVRKRKFLRTSGHAFAAAGHRAERHGAAQAATCQGDAGRFAFNACWEMEKNWAELEMISYRWWAFKMCYIFSPQFPGEK